MFLVWLGELITEKGIGNGISLIIFAGIVAGVPGAGPAASSTRASSFFGILLLGVIVLVAVASIVFFQEAQRRIPVQYSRTQFRGGRQYRQQGSTHIPLRVLSAGMIPIIFAYSIMLVPVVHRRDAGDIERRLRERRRQLADRRLRPAERAVLHRRVPVRRAVHVLLHVRDLSSSRTWRRTCRSRVASSRASVPASRRTTTSRACWCASLGRRVLPRPDRGHAVLRDDADGRAGADDLSGTGLLIVVGVVLDTMKQLEAQLHDAQLLRVHPMTVSGTPWLLRVTDESIDCI